MKRRAFLGLGLAAAAAPLAACTPPGQTSTQGQESLVLYSNSVADGRGEWLQEQAKAAGFAITFVNLGGGDAMNRLTAEKNNPIADVTFGLNNVYFEKLKAADVLEAYTPSWAADVDAALGDQAGATFWPIVREPIMLVYNTAAYANPADAPQDWPDLWTKPQFKGRYETQTSLGGATVQMVLSGLLARHFDAAGELGVSADGWSAVQAFFANGSPAVQGTDLYARMKDGAVDAGQMWLAGKAQREKQYGITTEAVKPSVGVPYAVQQVALVKGSKKAETAKKFVDWFGGAELQAAWSKEFFTAPTNQQALAAADADAVAQTDAFTQQDIDWGIVAANLDAWVEKVELEYVKA